MKLKTRVVGFGALAAILTTYVLAFLIIGSPWAMLPRELSNRNHPTGRLGLKSNDRGDINHGRPSHLGVVRKDLDISNFTSELSSTHGKMGLSFLNMTNQQVFDYLRSSNLLKNNETASSIIRIAHLIENYQQNINNNGGLHQEFVPNFLSPKDDQPLRRRVAIGQAELTPPNKQKPLKMSFPTAYYNMVNNHAIRDTSQLDVTVSPSVLSALNEMVDNMRETHRKRKRRRGPSLDIYTPSDASPAWERFHNHISQFHLYSEDDGIVDELLGELASLPIVHMVPKSGGTQLKLTFTFTNNAKAMWKPMRFPREQETLPDHFYFVDFERHNAEIAAFHLDRVFGFRRVVPVVGRVINITQVIRPLASYDIAKTIFVSPAGNVCFHGKCDYYCDSGHPVCGHPDALEGSFAAYLPSQVLVKRKTWRHPWRRSYHKRRIADWQQRPEYCSRIKREPPYNSGRRLLDLMDLAAFDFLTGNMDRHHYETFEDFGNYTFTLVLDNGRAFGKSRHDQRDILAPIHQCCLFRYSTLQKLLKFDEGPRHLSDLMRDSMSRDPINPILTEPHLAALDRRVKIILNIVHSCVIKMNGSPNVIIDDGF